MGRDSKIQWTDHTFNPVWGCAKVSEGCRHCYAETLSIRFGKGIWGPKASRRTFGDKHWNEPRRWNRAAEKEEVRRRVFCGSMCDVFEDHPTVNVARVRLFELIQETPWLDWLLLTKRPENVLPFLDAPLSSNVWMGTSVEDQAAADRRIPVLLKIPAAIRFVSAEPLIAPISFKKWTVPIDWEEQRIWWDMSDGDYHRPVCETCGDEEMVDAQEYYCDWINESPELIPCPDCQAAEYEFRESARWRNRENNDLHWIIVGGESGPACRGMDVPWAKSIFDECAESGIRFFMKQMGGYPEKRGNLVDIPPPIRRREFPETKVSVPA